MPMGVTKHREPPAELVLSGLLSLPVLGGLWLTIDQVSLPGGPVSLFPSLVGALLVVATVVGKKRAPRLGAVLACCSLGWVLVVLAGSRSLLEETIHLRPVYEDWAITHLVSAVAIAAPCALVAPFMAPKLRLHGGARRVALVVTALLMLFVLFVAVRDGDLPAWEGLAHMREPSLGERGRELARGFGPPTGWWAGALVTALTSSLVLVTGVVLRRRASVLRGHNASVDASGFVSFLDGSRGRLDPSVRVVGDVLVEVTEEGGGGAYRDHALALARLIGVGTLEQRRGPLLDVAESLDLVALVVALLGLMPLWRYVFLPYSHVVDV